MWFAGVGSWCAVCRGTQRGSDRRYVVSVCPRTTATTVLGAARTGCRCRRGRRRDGGRACARDGRTSERASELASGGCGGVAVERLAGWLGGRNGATGAGDKRNDTSAAAAAAAAGMCRSACSCGRASRPCDRVRGRWTRRARHRYRGRPERHSRRVRLSSRYIPRRRALTPGDAARHRV